MPAYRVGIASDFKRGVTRGNSRTERAASITRHDVGCLVYGGGVRPCSIANLTRAGTS